jgi:hypothetical protein
VVHFDVHVDAGAVVELVGEVAVLEDGDYPAYRLGGVVLDVTHVGVHRREPEMLDHAAEFLDAFLVRGDLRAEVRDVGGRVP